MFAKVFGPLPDGVLVRLPGQRRKEAGFNTLLLIQRPDGLDDRQLGHPLVGYQKREAGAQVPADLGQFLEALHPEPDMGGVLPVRLDPGDFDFFSGPHISARPPLGFG